MVLLQVVCVLLQRFSPLVFLLLLKKKTEKRLRWESNPGLLFVRQG